MKYILFLAGTIALFSCNSSQPSKTKAYPQQIEGLRVQDLYDSAKWYLYTWNCDVLYKPKSDSAVVKAFSELELEFNSLAIKHDTLILIFDFKDNGQPILPSMSRDNLQVPTGIGFNMVSKEKIFMAFSYAYSSYKGDPKNRYVNPLQPEVIAFIKGNKDKLAPWFRDEAKRRKIIQ